MKLSTIIDTAIVIVCLPFYTVAVPFMWLCESLWQRRTIRLGQQVVHWPARDVREDFLAVDLTRIEEGLVGIKRRRWGTLGGKVTPPTFPDDVEFVTVGMFWIGRN